MKKITALALVLVLLLALCACGETAAPESENEVPAEVQELQEVLEVPEQYRKYEDLVNALEAGDYDAALALIDAMAPAPELPPITEVQITTDNFLDYFSFVEFPEQGRREKTDDDGNTALIMRSGYYLKDGYTIAAEKAGECSVHVGLKYEILMFSNGKGIKTDLENVSYEVTGMEDSVFEGDKLFEGRYINYLPDTEPYYYVYVADTRLAEKTGFSSLIPEEKIELVSASGTLFLYE